MNKYEAMVIIKPDLSDEDKKTLFKHTDNIDPEAAFNTSIGYAGIEGTQLPSTRTLGFNVNLKFK